MAKSFIEDALNGMVMEPCIKGIKSDNYKKFSISGKALAGLLGAKQSFIDIVLRMPGEELDNGLIMDVLCSLTANSDELNSLVAELTKAIVCGDIEK